MRKIDHSLRLVVGDPTGRRSSTWRIWFEAIDVYAGFRTICGMRKASIHFPRPGHPNTLRYIGPTQPFAQRTRGSRVSRQERTDVEWPGLEFAPGYFIDFRFRIPETELRVLDSDGARDVRWLTPPPAGAASEVTILSGPATHRGPRPRRDDGDDELLKEHRLADGQVVWILHQHIPTPPDAVLQSYRDQVKREAVARGWLKNPLTRNSRITLTMNCEDGSFAEVELAADFLAQP
jgi:hypothetical protein